MSFQERNRLVEVTYYGFTLYHFSLSFKVSKNCLSCSLRPRWRFSVVPLSILMRYVRAWIASASFLNPWKELFVNFLRLLSPLELHVLIYVTLWRRSLIFPLFHFPSLYPFTSQCSIMRLSLALNGTLFIMKKNRYPPKDGWKLYPFPSRKALVVTSHKSNDPQSFPLRLRAKCDYIIFQTSFQRTGSHQLSFWHPHLAQ